MRGQSASWPRRGFAPFISPRYFGVLLLRPGHAPDFRRPHVGLFQGGVERRRDVEAVQTRFFRRDEGAEAHRDFAAGQIDRDGMAALPAQVGHQAARRRTALFHVVRAVYGFDERAGLVLLRKRLDFLCRRRRLMAGDQADMLGLEMLDDPERHVGFADGEDQRIPLDRVIQGVPDLFWKVVAGEPAADLLSVGVTSQRRK